MESVSDVQSKTVWVFFGGRQVALSSAKANTVLIGRLLCRSYNQPQQSIVPRQHNVPSLDQNQDRMVHPYFLHCSPHPPANWLKCVFFLRPGALLPRAYNDSLRVIMISSEHHHNQHTISRHWNECLGDTALALAPERWNATFSPSTDNLSSTHIYDVCVRYTNHLQFRVETFSFIFEAILVDFQFAQLTRLVATVSGKGKSSPDKAPI